MGRGATCAGLPVSSWSARNVAILAGLVAAAAFLASVVEVCEPDVFHHLAMGRHLARHGLDTAEPFLAEFRDVVRGPPVYWLGSLGIYGWEVLFGEAGLPFLGATIGALVAAILFLDASPRGERHGVASVAAAVLPLVLAVLAFRYRAQPRTELVATALVAYTMFAIRRHEEGRGGALYALPLLSVVWTNLHPSVAAGMVPVGVYAAVEWVRGLRASGSVEGTPSLRRAWSATAVLLAVGVASAANPSPSNPLFTAIRFAAGALGLGLPGGGATAARSKGLLVGLVQEMRPPGPDLWITPAGLALAVVAFAFAVNWRRLRAREIVTVLLFGWLATKAWRFGALAAVVAAPMAARNLYEAIAALPDAAGRLRLRRFALVMMAAVGVAATAHPLVVEGPQAGARVCERFPRHAVDYLANVGYEGRIFNTFDFGGYLAWREVGTPFVDGRLMLPSGYERGTIEGPANPAAFDRLDERYRFDALLLGYPRVTRASAAARGASHGAADWLVDSIPVGARRLRRRRHALPSTRRAALGDGGQGRVPVCDPSERGRRTGAWG